MSVEEEEGAEMGCGGGKGGARKHAPSQYLLHGPPAGHSYLTGRINGVHPPSSVCSEDTLPLFLQDLASPLIPRISYLIRSINKIKQSIDMTYFLSPYK